MSKPVSPITATRTHKPAEVTRVPSVTITGEEHLCLLRRQLKIGSLLYRHVADAVGYGSPDALPASLDGEVTFTETVTPPSTVVTVELSDQDARNLRRVALSAGRWNSPDLLDGSIGATMFKLYHALRDAGVDLNPLYPNPLTPPAGAQFDVSPDGRLIGEAA